MKIKENLGVWILGCWLLGCWFLGSLARFLNFLVVGSWFLVFLVSEISRMSISCFLEDIDLISKLFKVVFNGSSSFVSENANFVVFQSFETYKHNIFEKVPGMFLNLF